MASLDVSHPLDQLAARAGPPPTAPARERPQPLPERISRIVVLVPSNRTRAWVLRLVEVLRQTVGLPTIMLRAPWPAQETAIPSEVWEAHLPGAAPSGHAAWVSTAWCDPPEPVAWPDTLLINATERDPRTLPAPLRQSIILSPTFHGLFGSAGLVRPLLGGEAPHLGVVLSSRDGARAIEGARVVATERVIMRRALHPLFGREISLLLRAVEHVLDGRPLPPASPPPAPAPEPRGLDFWRRLMGAGLPRVAQHLQEPFVGRHSWCIGVRPVQGDVPLVDSTWEPAAFRLFDGGPNRAYADPFLLRHGGLTAMFFEDYDHGAGRARISCLPFDPDGRPGAPAEVLSRPYRLSYPFVFAHAGAAFMIPDTSENRTIELYQAHRFPDDWRLRTVLIENVVASGATLHFDGQTGLWWMFASVAEFDSSSCDTLSIFHSEELAGPWRPHVGNPVKLDPACSRPGGPLRRWGGRLFRPTRDCTRTCGAALVWCEIKELSLEAFREDPVARQPPGRGCAGVHTYGRAAGLEVVDFKRNRSRRKGPERPLDGYPCPPNGSARIGSCSE
jgi:hypothetical protein